MAFAGAAFSVIMVFAASGSPIPLYGTYRSQEQLSSGQVSLTAVAYFAAVVATLLVLARVSNHLGRRPVVLAALVLVAAGTVALIDVQGLGSLIIARIGQGIGCGLVSSALAAYVVDLAPTRPAWLGAAVTGTGPMVGLTLGSVLTGALAEYGDTLVWGYVIIVALLVVAMVITVISPDTVTRTPGIGATLRPQVRVPQRARSLLPAAAAVLVATWALGGFYQAFSPLLAADRLGTTNTLVAAAIFSSYMAPSVLGSPLAGWLSTRAAQRLGMIAFVAGMALLLTALAIESVGLFLVAGVIAGIAQALACTGSINGLVQTATAAERAGLLSAIFLISYTGAAVPGFLAGRLAGLLDTGQILIGYAGLAVLATAFVLITHRTGETR